MSLSPEDLVANDKVEIKRLYDKIKLKAEEYYSKGNTDKAIELYERAVRLYESDTAAAKRLKELKAL